MTRYSGARYAVSGVMPSVACLFFWISTGVLSAESPGEAELEALRAKRNQLVGEAVRDLDARYLANLEILLKKAVLGNDPNQMMEIRQEVKRVQQLIESQEKPVQTPAPEASPPENLPVVKIETADLLWLYMADTEWSLSNPAKENSSKRVYFGKDGIAVFDGGRKRGKWWCVDAGTFHVFTENDVGKFSADWSSLEIVYDDGSRSAGKRMK